MIKTSLSNIVITTLLLLNSPKSPATNEILQTIAEPAQEEMFKNKTYRFSFSIPSGWEKQSGNPNSSNVLFMQIPIANSCSFQFNVTPMTATFPTEASVNAALALAHRELKSNKLTSVKRRDTWIKEKIMLKGKEKESLVLLIRGWEMTEKPHKQKLQRIIYQAYDRQNRYFNFVAAATSEKFAHCEPELRKVMDSISFISF
jgi:hypothetical protein